MSALPHEEAGRSAGVHPAHRGSIFLEEGSIVSQESWPGEQFVLRITAPKCAARALPGSFVHLTCDPDVPMRRPLSIQRVNASEGWIEILYKIVGPGLRALSRRRAGDAISVLGPIGQPFRPDPQRPRALLVGGGVGIPPMVFLAEWMIEQGWQALEAAGAHGLGDSVSVQGPALDHSRARHSRRQHRRDAAARWLGRAQPARIEGRLSRLLRRLRHAARG